MTAKLTFEQLLIQMRSQLRGRGTAKLVRLFLTGIYYVTEQAAQEFVDEFERRSMQCKATGDKLSKLESLGLAVLLDSSSYKME